MRADLIRDFSDLGISDRAVAGGKGASLGELTRAGIRVPPGFVVTTAAFERVLPDGVRRRVAGSPDDQIARATAEVRDLVAGAPVPDDVRTAIIEGYLALGDDVPVAVRSSATGEDAADASFAGLQDTYLWVRGAEAVLDRVRQCWASLYSERSVTYRRERGLAEDGHGMAVVVQRMVDPRSSGVMFTRSPTTGDRSVVAIEACWGLGSALVGGDVTPDSYIVNKITGEVIKRAVSAKVCRHRRDPGGGVLVEDVPEELQTKPCLGDDELRELVRVARRAEDHYGEPQDIEWAFVDDHVVLLQSRPETVWSGRADAPLAAPKRRAFDHVLDSLSRGAAR
jgi:pyruvate, water dikinase